MIEADSPKGKSLGSAGETVENLHAVQQDAEGRPPSPAVASQQNPAYTGAEGGGAAGSEPLFDRQTEHVSGYGGMLGAARTSADEREPEDPTGETPGGRATPTS